jgi:small multidrug resistance family-3 protein
MLRLMKPVAVVPVFVLTALAEIGGCYLVFLWTRGNRAAWLLAGAAALLGLFAWLLSFHAVQVAPTPPTEACT